MTPVSQSDDVLTRQGMACVATFLISGEYVSASLDRVQRSLNGQLKQPLMREDGHQVFISSLETFLIWFLWVLRFISYRRTGPPAVLDLRNNKNGFNKLAVLKMGNYVMLTKQA